MPSICDLPSPTVRDLSMVSALIVPRAKVFDEPADDVFPLDLIVHLLVWVKLHNQLDCSHSVTDFLLFMVGEEPLRAGKQRHRFAVRISEHRLENALGLVQGKSAR